MRDTKKIERQLFVDKPVITQKEPADKEEAQKVHKVCECMDEKEDKGWWSSPESQDLIRELAERYSEDTRYERSRMNGYEQLPTIVEMIGLYPEKDILKAARWYEKKGTEGSLKSFYYAGLLYKISQEYLLAATCFFKAAEGDFIHEASFHLALLYENGLITDGPDILSAISWYKRGAMGLDRFSEASTRVLKELGVISCWADLGYDHSAMMQKRKRNEEANRHDIQKRSSKMTEKEEDTPQVKESFWEKAEFVGLMLLVLPCLAISGCYDWAKFKCSDKYRRKVYCNLKKNQNRLRRSVIRPDEEDEPWQRNRTAVVRHIYTDEELYPECKVSILVPKESDIYTDGLTIQEWFSVKVPGRFHCLDWQKPETLKETDFLKVYMNKNGLTDAIVVLNDASSVYERMKRFYNRIHEFPETIYMGCHVELLTRTEPQSDVNYEKVSYRVLELPVRFRLEQDSLHRLDGRSEKIYGEYKDKVCKLKD